MKKINLLSGLFSSSSKIIEKIQPRLMSLEAEIEKIKTMDNKVEAIVKFFQVISPLQDAKVFRWEIFCLKIRNRNGKFNAQIEALGALRAHFYIAGRSGINRTAKGEDVTAEKIYLGNVFGLPPNTAAYWLKEQSLLEKTFRPDVSGREKPVSNWDLINDQCGGFVKSHTDGILSQIKVLKAV